MLGHYLNHSEQGERLRELLEITPSGPSSPILRTPKRICKRLDTTKMAELVQGYADGLPIDELVTRFQVDQSTVQKHVREHGLPRRSPRLGPKQVEEAAQLYQAGQSLAKLSTHFGVATDTVALALRRAGLTLRPRKGWAR
jgi:DNA-directed RNA polymerase specialized sigma24 family protein